MAKIHEILARGRSVSFEFFPPRTDEAQATLERTLIELEPLPAVVRVGDLRGRGHDPRAHPRHRRPHQPRDDDDRDGAPHVRGAHPRRAHRDHRRYGESGIENILALGGDPPADLDLPPGELKYAVELVRLVRSLGDFSIGVAAHPEPHPRSPVARASDRRHTAEKLAEADFAITQFFFDADHYFELVESLHRLGVDKPVIPGIMPVLNLGSIKRMSEMQGSKFPEWLAEKLNAVGDDPAAVRRVGIEEATDLCRRLLDGGAPGLHFYTLNRSTATREIYDNLGLEPAV